MGGSNLKKLVFIFVHKTLGRETPVATSSVKHCVRKTFCSSSFVLSTFCPIGQHVIPPELLSPSSTITTTLFAPHCPSPVLPARGSSAHCVKFGIMICPLSSVFSWTLSSVESGCLASILSTGVFFLAGLTYPVEPEKSPLEQAIPVVITITTPIISGLSLIDVTFFDSSGNSYRSNNSVNLGSFYLFGV